MVGGESWEEATLYSPKLSLSGMPIPLHSTSDGYAHRGLPGRSQGSSSDLSYVPLPSSRLPVHAEMGKGKLHTLRRNCR